MYLRSTFSFLVLFGLLSILLSAESFAQENEQLKEHYQTWRKATLEADFAQWSKLTSSRRQREMENEIISRGELYPSALFALEIKPPEIDNLHLIASRASAECCYLFFLGKVDFKLGIPRHELPSGLLQLRYHREGDAWLFDSLSYFNFEGQAETLRALEQGNVESLATPAFAPPEKLPPLIERVPRPEFIAQLYIRAPFHRVEAQINGIQHRYRSVGETQIATVLGGLREGDNQVRFAAVELPGAPYPYPLPEQAQREKNSAPLEISLWLVPTRRQAIPAPKLVWRWTASSREDLPREALTKQITVSKELLAN